jgi:hypothetical protein
MVDCSLCTRRAGRGVGDLRTLHRPTGIFPDTNGTPAVRAVVEDNLHSEVEHPDAWAHRNLDELDRADVAAVREMSTGAGGAGNERGAPAMGPPFVWVWLPVRDVDVRLDVHDPRVVAEVGRDVDRRCQADRRVDGRGGLGGGGEAENGACEPASDDGGKSEFVHCGASSFCLLLCSSRGAKSRFGRCVGR